MYIAVGEDDEYKNEGEVESVFSTTEVSIMKSLDKLYEEEPVEETGTPTSEVSKVSAIMKTSGYVKLKFRNVNVPIETLGFNSATLRLQNDDYNPLEDCLVLNCHNTSYTINHCPQQLQKV